MKLALQLTGKSDASADSVGIVRSKAYDNTRVRMCGKIFCRVTIAASPVGSMGRSITDVQPTAVFSHALTCIQIVNSQLTKRLIVLREVPLNIPLQPVCLRIIAFAQRLTNGRNALVCIRREDFLARRFSRPKRNVIQRNFVLLCATIDNAAHSAIADDQSLFEERCRFVIVQSLRSCFDRHNQP